MNQADKNKLNYLPQLRAELEKDIKAQLEKEILQNLFDDFKERVQPEIRERLKSLTLKQVETYKSMMCMRDELLVHININGEVTKAEL